MEEFLTALRNVVIAMILAWIGVSFSDSDDDTEPAEEPTVLSGLLQ